MHRWSSSYAGAHFHTWGLFQYVGSHFEMRVVIFICGWLWLSIIAFQSFCVVSLSLFTVCPMSCCGQLALVVGC